MSEPPPGKAPWRLLGRDQIVLCVLAALVLAVGAARYVSPHFERTKPVQKLEPGQRVDYRVDLNKATEGELDLLPGIGPAKAKRIVEYRQSHGPFKELADLARVPGMNRDCVAKLRGLVTPDAAGDDLR